jgi:hypothetical protein
MPSGIRFEAAAAPPQTAQNRMDVGCFVGFVRAREATLPDWLQGWFVEQGWLGAVGGRARSEIEALLQVPVPVVSWSSFEALFDWQADSGSAYLAAAVRSFFAQGGRKCFVVRVGDPLALDSPRSRRLAATTELIPGLAGVVPALAPHEPGAWRGITHLHGLHEVAFVCMPDLPLLVAQSLEAEEPAPADAGPSPFFVECSIAPPAPANTPPRSVLRAPRLLDMGGYRDWALRIGAAADFIRTYRKDVQLIATVPLAATGSEVALDPLAAFVRAGLMGAVERGSAGLGSAHVQLVYPWVSWEGTRGLPEELEPAEGVLAGVVARVALLKGAFASLAGQSLYQVFALYPELSIAQRSRTQPTAPSSRVERSLAERVTLLGLNADGFRVLSDVTTSADEAWRSANSNRLMSIWVRALRDAGETLVFDASNEALWAELRSRVEAVGRSLFRQGALNGALASEAFEVRCDRTTMSTSDLDNGRVIAEVLYQPALPIESIRLAFTLNESQRVTVNQVSA